MADTIQVLEGLFATPVVVEDERGRALRGLGTTVPATPAGVASGVASSTLPLLLMLGAIWWLFGRGR